MYNWLRFKCNPCFPLGENGRRITGCDEHINLSRKAAGEGMVLLKNEANILPLSPENRIALFGKASADYVKGGGGSGDTTVEYVRNLCEAMEIKETEQKVKLLAPINEFYRNFVTGEYSKGIVAGRVAEPEIPIELLQQASEECDIAVVSICRYSEEDHDRTVENDYYLSEDEKKLVSSVTECFKKTVVVLNVGGVIDTSWFYKNPKIPAVLLAWQAGMEGGMAQADILCGDVCPSGKLTDTLAEKLEDYPSFENFNKAFEYAEYTEDIFVGYRYFETVPEKALRVNYPFGFGLSYTKFSIEKISAFIQNGNINIKVKVTNIGKVSGKETVQVYTSSPNGVYSKPAKELRAFSKTGLLSPNDSQEITLTFAVNDLAYFNEERSAFVLESGKYTVLVGNSIRDLTEYFEFNLDEQTVYVCGKYCIPKKLSRRMQADGTYKEVETSEYDNVAEHTDWPKKINWTYDPIQPDMRDCDVSGVKYSLIDVADGKVNLEKFINQLSNADLIDLAGGRPNSGVANTRGFGDLPKYAIPPVMTADGPAGLRILPDKGIYTTAFPCATLLACTWNTELVERVNRAGALEVLENNLGVWLTPALNIHRNPLCGRNFEYFSEDPIVSGEMAKAAVKGIQSVGISACVKHFCCNNKETGRYISDSRVSERALREIYLKGFEMVIKDAKPWVVMTSYNVLNGIHLSENKELIKGILRGEWGYDGLVISDWGNAAEHYRELKAGNNIRMPFGSGSRMLRALEEGLITRGELEENAYYVLDFILKLK